MTTAKTRKEIIRAAGALLWRQSATGREIAIVHRKRYDDWTLPKGKLNDGESWQRAALREVREETGYDAKILGYAGALSYKAGSNSKVVRFWHMMASGNSRQRIDDEVGEVVWLTPHAALKRLQYPLEQALLEASLQKLPSNTWLNSIKRRWRNYFRPASLQRLGNTLDLVESDLDAVIELVKKSNNKFVAGWDLRSRHLLDIARQAYIEADEELGWRCLNAANRFMYYGLTPEQLRIEARPILAEANDEGKGLSKWRKTSIQQLLGDNGGKRNKSLKPQDVARAKRVLDEHHDNVYQKLKILRSRLLLLTIASFVALVAWLFNPPFLPSSSLLTSHDAHNWLSPWFGVILSGLLGALFSGFTSSIAADQTKTRIPTELSSTSITFARLSMAVVASLAASIFLISGVLNIPPPSYELMLAVAFASGFSERLLLRGIQSLSK